MKADMSQGSRGGSRNVPKGVGKPFPAGMNFHRCFILAISAIFSLGVGVQFFDVALAASHDETKNQSCERKLTQLVTIFEKEFAREPEKVNTLLWFYDDAWSVSTGTKRNIKKLLPIRNCSELEIYKIAHSIHPGPFSIGLSNNRRSTIVTYKDKNNIKRAYFVWKHDSRTIETALMYIPKTPY